MAEKSEDNTKAIREMTQAILDQNKMDMFPRTTDERSLDALSKQIEDLDKGNVAQTKAMIKAYNEAMKENGIKKEFKTLKDVLKNDDQLKAMKSIQETLLSNAPDEKSGTAKGMSFGVATDMVTKMNRDAESAGTTLEEMGIQVTKFYNRSIGQWEVRVKDQVNVTEKLVKKTHKLTRATDEGAEKTRKFGKEVDLAKSLLSKLGAGVKKAGGDFLKLAEQEQRFAQQNATADAGWIDGLMQMQITTIDYMKILKETRVESLAMTGAGRDFKQTLIDGQKSLVGFTADSTEAANVSKAFIKNTSRMGVAQGDLEGAVAQQTDIYKEHYRVLGYSADEFAKLTEELINDQGMRSVLLGLKEKERKQYVMGIQQRMAEYQTMGYTIERAKELQKTFQALNAMNPKERMKQAAKTRAMMGAMGMGAEGEELFNLETQYRTMSEKDKGAADMRMTEIKAKAAAKFGEKSGSGAGMGQAMSFQMMADKTGFTAIANTFETASGEGLKITKDQLAAAQTSAEKANEISETAKTALQVQDTWRAAQGTALSSIATNLLSGLGNLASINTVGFAATVMASKGIGKMMGGGGGGKIGKMGKGLGAGAALYAAWEAGSFIGDKIADVLQSTGNYGFVESAVGGIMDGVTEVQAWAGNEAAQNRIDSKAFVEEMRLTREENRKIADEQLLRADQATEATKEGTDVVDKNAKVQQTANQIALNKSSRAGEQ